MNTIAITGASGFIGKYLVAELLRLGGFRIKLLSRNPVQDLSGLTAGVEIVEGDLSEPESLRDFLEEGCTVINLVYLWGAGEDGNISAITNLLAACKSANVSRLIHLSTADVVGRVADNHITEDTQCHPISEYAITKLKVENTIREVGKDNFDVVILRPSAVFGPGGVNLRKLAEELTSGNWLRNYVKSCLFGNRRMNLVHITSVVAAVLLLIRSAKQFDGEAFIISDDDPQNNFASVELRLMQVFEIGNYPLLRLRLPLGILSSLLIVLGRNNANPRCQYDSGKLLMLGFKRPVSFIDGLTEYAAWYRSEHLDSVLGSSKE